MVRLKLHTLLAQGYDHVMVDFGIDTLQYSASARRKHMVTELHMLTELIRMPHLIAFRLISHASIVFGRWVNFTYTRLCRELSLSDISIVDA